MHQPMHELSLAYLAEFDVLFHSGMCFVTELAPFIKLLYQKSLRFVYCPHGNSDKGHSSKQHLEQDVVLFYGEHMRLLLEKTGASQKIRTLVRTGNLRLAFYQKYRAFYTKILQERVLPHLQAGKQTVLYAPTWQDGENPSSFFQQMKRVCEQLPGKGFNVLIKLHPLLELFHPAQVAALESYCEQRPDVLLLRDFPVIYPLLEITDLYLGDYSSIGYDYLFFDKPLYFFPGDLVTSAVSALHKCGELIPEDVDLSDFLSCQDSRDKGSFRKQMYQLAFGEERAFDIVKKEIGEAVQEPLLPCI
ncbi:MAG: hypothetical protein FJZ58_07790 [Chlamydiae bacterium]|nr:hypothetical protein [Chlamydiota bacterium]